MLNSIKRYVRYFLKYIKYTIVSISMMRCKGKIKQTDYSIGDNLKLFYWRYDKKDSNNQNLGDYLSKVVVEHFMPKVSSSIRRNKGKTLYAIGSILGFRVQDAVVWGTGLLEDSVDLILKTRFSKLDIRAVRGPKTRRRLLAMGKKVPKIYGDPAILMPQIYFPSKAKKYDVSLILHYSERGEVVPSDVNLIDIVTKDYKKFIDEIVSSRLIISSSLHGIILAETYGVPAILYIKGAKKVPFKFEDWYNSTGRYSIVMANSWEQAMEMKPMNLPNLTDMQRKLLQSFPYDLWS